MNIVTLGQEHFADHLEDVVDHGGSILQPLHVLMLQILNLIMPLLRQVADLRGLLVDHENHGSEGNCQLGVAHVGLVVLLAQVYEWNTPLNGDVDMIERLVALGVIGRCILAHVRLGLSVIDKQYLKYKVKARWMIQLEVELLKDVTLHHGYHFLRENIAAYLRSLLVRQYDVLVVLHGNDEANNHDELIHFALNELVLLNIPITVDNRGHNRLILKIVVLFQL